MEATASARLGIQIQGERNGILVLGERRRGGLQRDLSFRPQLSASTVEGCICCLDASKQVEREKDKQALKIEEESLTSTA